MIYRVRVKHDHALAGYGKDNARLNIRAGEYEVEPASVIYDVVRGAEGVLYFKRADHRDGGDLAVKRGEFPFLWDFPRILPGHPLEVL